MGEKPPVRSECMDCEANFTVSSNVPTTDTVCFCPFCGSSEIVQPDAVEEEEAEQA